MERKFLEHSLLRSESSRGVKVPWNESSWTFRSPGANVPQNESSTGVKVLSMDFSLPGTKVQRNKKARYLRVRVRYRAPMFATAPLKVHVSLCRGTLKVDGTTEQQLANIQGQTADGTAKKLDRTTERPTEQQY